MKKDADEQTTKICIQTADVYVDPVLTTQDGAQGHRLGISVIKKMPYFAMVGGFYLAHACFTANFIGIVFYAMCATNILRRYPFLDDSYRKAVGRIQICRLVRDGKKDTVCNMVKVIDLVDGKTFRHSRELKIVDPGVIRANQEHFENLLYKSFPVWLANCSYVVTRGGQTKDINLFKAVMNGHSIELTGNIARENRLK